MSLARRRIAKQGLISLFCFGVQSAVLLLLVSRGFGPSWLANSTGFLVSTQCNFMLGLTITWRDQFDGSVSEIIRRWRTLVELGKYNLTATLSLGINTVVFALCRGLFSTQLMVAALIGAVCGFVSTYVLCRYVYRQPASVRLINERGAQLDCDPV